MSFLRKAFQKALDLAQGEARPLNVGSAAGIANAGALKHTLDTLAANAFDLEKGRIDYSKIKTDPGYAQYQAQAAALRTFNPRALDRDDQLAFWLNIYNALTIDAVIAFGVKESVREVPRLGFFRQAAYTINGHIFSLDDIEHGILRGNQRHPAHPVPPFSDDDPRKQYVISPFEVRVHFGLTCASRSCPPIAFYDGKKIEAQLKSATENFLTGGGCDIDFSARSAALSEIFKWYSSDFGGADGILRFIAKNHPDAKAKDLFSSHSMPPSISYTPYDWNLNK